MQDYSLIWLGHEVSKTSFQLVFTELSETLSFDTYYSYPLILAMFWAKQNIVKIEIAKMHTLCMTNI